MDCCFDWCTFYSDLSLGFISSVFASIFTAVIIFWYRRRQDRKMFSKAAGKFLGYTPIEQNPRKLSEGPKSKAQIFYEGKNRLRIQLTHDDGKRTWEGVITMENEHYGSLSWQYINMPPGQYEFGFKRCIISSDGDAVMLIQEAQSKQDDEVRYGREILIRKK
jgi:hypothetical protein